MKKVISFFFLMSFMLFSFNANAADCSQVSTKFCQAMDKVTKQVKTCRTIDDLDRIDFDSAINSVDFSNIPDECAYARLTSSDKTKIKASLGGFFDALSDKTYELGGGMISRQEINAQFGPMKKLINQLVDESDNFEELCTNLGSL